MAVEDMGKAAGQKHLQGNQAAPEPDRACSACHSHIHRGYTPLAFDKTCGRITHMQTDSHCK